jgi:hypothetical protein
MDSDTVVLVGSSYWNFLAREPIYDDLIKIFEECGDETKAMINDYHNQLL